MKQDCYLVPANIVQRRRDHRQKYNKIDVPNYMCGKTTFFTYGDEYWTNKELFKAVIENTQSELTEKE